VLFVGFDRVEMPARITAAGCLMGESTLREGVAVILDDPVKFADKGGGFIVG
jgi:hypothetical protein